MNRPPPVILVVAADRDLAEMLTALLPLEGYVPVVVHTAAAAIHQLQQRAPDLILSDLYLSEGTGWSVYQQLRAQPPYATLPLLLMSEPPPVALGVPDPFLDFIPKPFGPPRLFACIQSLLQRAARSHAEMTTNQDP